MQQTSTAAGHALPTSTGQDSRKLGMWAFLASECMFFGSLISVYLVYEGKSVVGPYPRDILNIPFTSVSTFVLLMSSFMVVLALAAIQRGDMRKFRVWLAATAVLGMMFLSGQAYEFSTFYREGLTLQRNLFGSTFFVLTGFHGAHVTVGVIWLVSLLVLSLVGKMGPGDVMRMDVAALYWHFVDVVWIVIFTVVYLLGTYT